jgi:hypothetical protein
METVLSADGTTIAFDRTGDGPPLVLVSGALGDRGAAGSVAQPLGERFTVFAFDRRGEATATTHRRTTCSARSRTSARWSTRLADALPRSRYRTLEGQDHGPASEVLVPALIGFLVG